MNMENEKDGSPFKALYSKGNHSGKHSAQTLSCALHLFLLAHHGQLYMSNVTDVVAATTCTKWHCSNVPPAIGVSIGAGLATAIGGALVFFPQFMKRVPQSTILGVSLALSAGVMLYVSFIEIFSKSLAEIESEFDPDEKPGQAVAITTVCFFAGIFLCIFLEYLVHSITARLDGSTVVCAVHGDVHDSSCSTTATSSLDGHGASNKFSRPGESHDQDGHCCAEEGCDTGNANGQVTRKTPGERDVELAHVDVASSPMAPPGISAPSTSAGELDLAERKRLTRMGIMTALAIGVHNFPEGLATFLATVDSISSGASLGVAIAIHNIPEGLCVAMPIYYATGSRWRAFGWSLVSGITEPIGGIAGYAALQPVFTPLVYGVVFSMVGGMMVFIVCHELLPAAHRYMGNPSKATAWFLLGMIVMASSLVLFSF